MAYDGSIRINVDVVSDKANKAIEKTTERIEKETDSIKKQEMEIARLKRQLEEYQSGKKKTAEQKSLEKGMEDAQKKAKSYGDALEEIVLKIDKLGSKGASPEAIAPYEAQADEIAQSLDKAEMEAAALKKQLEQVSMNPSATGTISDLKTKLELAENKLDRTKTGVTKLNDKLKQLKAEKVQKVKDSFAKMPSTLDNVSNKISKITSRVTKLASSVVIFGALSKAFTALRDTIGDYVKTNTVLNSNLQKTKGNLLTAFQPILEYVTPALETLSGWLSKATAYLASFINALFGKSTSASQKSAEGLHKQAEALGDVADSAKKASGSLAAFDELNNQQSDTSTTAETTVSFDTDFTQIDEETNTFWDKLVKKINPLTTSAKKLWDVVKKFGGSFVKGFIGFFKKLYELVGGEATIDGIINAIAGALEWVAEVIENIPPETAEACGAALAGIVTAILLFKTVNGIVSIVKSIGDAVSGLISSIMAHPYLAAAAAIAGIAAALITMSNASKEEYNNSALDAYMDEVDEAIQKSKDLNDEIDRFLVDIETDISDISTEYDAIRGIADRYMDLVENSKKSNDEKREQIALGETLKQKIPELEKYIDDETGAYKGTREELQKLINKTEEYYKLQAYKNSLATIAQKKIEIEASIAELEPELASLQGRIDDLFEQHASIRENDPVWHKGLQEVNAQLDELIPRRNELNEQLQAEKGNLEKLNKQWDVAMDYIGNYGEEADETTGKLRDSVDVLRTSAHRATVFGKDVANNFYAGIKSETSNGAHSSITSLGNGVNELESAVKKAEEYGKNVVEGFNDGIASASSKSVVARWAKSIAGTFTEKMEIHSPSKLFGRFADDTVDGYNFQIEDRISDTERAVKKWAQSIDNTALDTNFSFYNSVAPTSNFMNVFDTSKTDGILGNILAKLGSSEGEQTINVMATCDGEVLFRTTVKRNKQFIKQTGQSAYI